MFNIPNAADAQDVSQAQPDSRDFRDMIAAAFAGTGVVSGCAVTAQASPNMTVAVAAGSVAVVGTVAAVTGGNVTIVTANATNPRFDLICVDGAGVKQAVAGVPNAAPVFPDPAGMAVLAAVRVPANATTIDNAKIVDKRLNPVVVPVSEATGVIKAFGGTVAPAGYLLCNGAAVSRSTYANLFSLISTNYGVGDGSTTFNVPDAAGRSLLGLGSNTDVNAMGKNEGVAVANRTPVHNSTPALTVVGAPGVGNLTLPDHGHNITDVSHNHYVNDPGHAHQLYDYAVNFGGTGQGMAYAAPGATLTEPTPRTGMRNTGTNIYLSASGSGITHTDGVTSNPILWGAPSVGSLGVSGTIGPGGTRPVDRVPFIVVNYIIKT
jgi:microcystin-dependent protein